MWNIRTSDSDLTQPGSSSSVNSSTSPIPEASDAFAKAPTPSKLTYDSMIGKSIVIQGEIIATEPLYICGRVEGSVSAPGHRVTVWSEGEVQGDIDAQEIVIMGEVCGNLTGEQRVEIRKDGSVKGDISAARMSLEDGAFVLGAINICAPAVIDEPEVQEAPESAAEVEDAEESWPNLEVAQVA